MHDHDESRPARGDRTQSERLRERDRAEHEDDAERGQTADRVRLPEQQVRRGEVHREAVREALDQVGAPGGAVGEIEVLAHVADLEDEVRRVGAQKQCEPEQRQEGEQPTNVELRQSPEEPPASGRETDRDHEARGRCLAEAGEVAGAHQYERERDLHDQPDRARLEQEPGPLRPLPRQTAGDGRAGDEQRGEDDERPDDGHGVGAAGTAPSRYKSAACGGRYAAGVTVISASSRPGSRTTFSQVANTIR